MMDIKENLLLWSTGSGVANIDIKKNIQLAKQLHKPIISNF